MSFTMTLFGPSGSRRRPSATQATITDGVVPKASISALPVSPLDSPSFKGGAETYKGGAETGATLTAGATEIDANLLKLRDGAGDLLAGPDQAARRCQEAQRGPRRPGCSGAGRWPRARAAQGRHRSKLSAGARQAKDGSSQVWPAGPVRSLAGILDDGAQARRFTARRRSASGTGPIASTTAPARWPVGPV